MGLAFGIRSAMAEVTSRNRTSFRARRTHTLQNFNGTGTALAWWIIPDDVGFHRVCPSRFTDKQHIFCVQKHMSKSSEAPAPGFACMEGRPLFLN